jgi:hypothetical protein
MLLSVVPFLNVELLGDQRCRISVQVNQWTAPFALARNGTVAMELS